MFVRFHTVWQVGAQHCSKLFSLARLERNDTSGLDTEATTAGLKTVERQRYFGSVCDAEGLAMFSGYRKNRRFKKCRAKGQPPIFEGVEQDMANQHVPAAAIMRTRIDRDLRVMKVSTRVRV